IASVLRYYHARQRAETLAGGLARLARVAVAMTAATSQRELLEVAGAAAATVFESPAALVATPADGDQVAVVSGGPDKPVEVKPWATLTDPPVGVAVHDEEPTAWPSVGSAAELVRVLTLRNRPDRPALSVVVPLAATPEGAGVLTLFGQAVMSAMGAIRLHEEEHDLALTLQ